MRTVATFIPHRRLAWRFAVRKSTPRTVVSIVIRNKCGPITVARISSGNGVNVGARRATTFSSQLLFLAECGLVRIWLTSGIARRWKEAVAQHLRRHPRPALQQQERQQREHRQTEPRRLQP